MCFIIIFKSKPSWRIIFYWKNKRTKLWLPTPLWDIIWPCHCNRSSMRTDKCSDCGKAFFHTVAIFSSIFIKLVTFIRFFSGVYWYGFLLELGLRVVVLLMVILQWLPQWLHWYGLSPGWVLLCIPRWLVRDKALSHWLYKYDLLDVWGQVVSLNVLYIPVSCTI